MNKYVYIITDSFRVLVSQRTAFQSEQDALAYATQMNRIRLANGMKLINYHITRLSIE